MGNVISLKRLSEDLSRLLDELGFDEKRVQERIRLMKKLSEAKDISTKRILKSDNLEKIFVGSQRDGTGLCHCNDLDVLQINHGVWCQTDEHPANSETGKVIFHTVQKDKHPGYVLLKPLCEGNKETFQELEHALVERNREKYFSSELFMKRNEDISLKSTGLIGKNTKYYPPEGPSIPKCTNQDLTGSLVLSCMNLQMKNTDVVRAFPCDGKPFIKEWRKRKRKSGWPCQNTISDVEGLPAYVVPVGQRGSEDEDLQWRVCFTKTEIELIANFNNIQIKIYVLMKLIAKCFLQPISKDVSSYVVKNVMFWISEEIKQERFCQDNLVAILGETIKYLIKAVENKHLSNYMIPERNLFEGKLKGKEKTLIVDKLKFLLETGEKEIRNYMDKLGTLPEELEQVISTYRVAKEIETDQMKIMASFTKKQLVENYIQMFSYESQGSTCHNILFTDSAVPFLKIYGREWFSEVLSAKGRNQRKLLEQNLVNGFKKLKCGTTNSLKTVPFWIYHVFVLTPHCCA